MKNQKLDYRAKIMCKKKELIGSSRHLRFFLLLLRRGELLINLSDNIKIDG